MSKVDPISMHESHDFYNKLEDNLDRIGRHQSSMRISAKCPSCGVESYFIGVNYRNENMDYVEGYRECSECGKIVKRKTW